jgi:hypothetical protein
MLLLSAEADIAEIKNITIKKIDTWSLDDLMSSPGILNNRVLEASYHRGVFFERP